MSYGTREMRTGADSCENPTQVPAIREGPLWAITSYFDPFDRGHRLSVYREFRRRLSIPLVTVELGFDRPFHLKRGDADILIQRRGGSVLWQKERLLNLALSSVPAHAEAVAWIDCDVVFLRDDWPQAVLRALTDFEMLQPFQYLHYQDCAGRADTLHVSRNAAFESMARRFSEGTLPDGAYRSPGLSLQLRYAPGMAWAARRRTLDECGFYDASVLGESDKLMFIAAAGRYGTPIGWLSAAHRTHYDHWAARFSAAINRRIGHIEGDLVHLWHGDLASRRYAERMRGFERFDFDPNTDFGLTPGGVLRWSSNKPEMHAFVRQELLLTAPSPTSIPVPFDSFATRGNAGAAAGT